MESLGVTHEDAVVTSFQELEVEDVGKTAEGHSGVKAFTFLLE